MTSSNHVQYELLQGLSPQQLDRVLARSKTMAAASGQVLFQLGEPATQVFLIKSGVVALSLPLQIQSAERNVSVREQGPGETVGWSALVAPERYTLSARAVTDSELLTLTSAQLRELFVEDQSIGFCITRNLAELVALRLHKLQAMWLRELQRGLDVRQRAGA